MSFWWWVALVCCWATVPGVILLKAYLDAKDRKAHAKFQKEIQPLLERLTRDARSNSNRG